MKSIFANNPEFHGTVNIASSVRFGENCTVWQFATVCHDVVLGDNVVIGSNVWIGPYSIVGSGTRIQHGAFIPASTVIGRNVFIGPNVTLTDDKYPAVTKENYVPMSPILQDGCSLGAACVLLPGVVVHARALVGAGAVVTKDVKADTVVVGVPATQQT